MEFETTLYLKQFFEFCYQNDFSAALNKLKDAFFHQYGHHLHAKFQYFFRVLLFLAQKADPEPDPFNEYVNTNEQLREWLISSPFRQDLQELRGILENQILLVGENILLNRIIPELDQLMVEIKKKIGKNTTKTSGSFRP